MAPAFSPLGAFVIPTAPSLRPFLPSVTAGACIPRGRRHSPTVIPVETRPRWPHSSRRGLSTPRLPVHAAATLGPAEHSLEDPPQTASAATAADATINVLSPSPSLRCRVVRFLSAPDNRALVVGVVLCWLLTAVIWLAGGRLAGVPLRLDRSAPFDYPWRLRGRPGGEGAAAAATAAYGVGAMVRRWSAWVFYALHQVGHWVLIAATRAQQRKQRHGVAAMKIPSQTANGRAAQNSGRGGTSAVDNGGVEATARSLRRPFSRSSRTVGWPQRATLALHAVFCSARIAHTHLLSYDGLAADVPEVTSLAAVALLLVWVWLLEAPRRGVFAGTRPPRLLTAPALRATAVATHGYYFSFATIYTLWYHPAASTVAHLSGFLYVFLLLLQSGLAGTAAHGGRWWTSTLEGWVAVHALVTAATVGGGRLVPLFGWGLATSFMAVHLHGFGLHHHVRAGVTAAYALGAALAMGVGLWGTRGWHLVAIPMLLYAALGGLVLVLGAMTALGWAVRANKRVRVAPGTKEFK